MNRRALKFFGIGLFILTFGCKGGSALKFAGVAAVTTARVVAAGAAVANASERGAVRTGDAPVLATPGVEPVAARGATTPVPCTMLCSAVVDNRFVYVCAAPVPGIDAEGRPVVAYVCN